MRVHGAIAIGILVALTWSGCGVRRTVAPPPPSVGAGFPADRVAAATPRAAEATAVNPVVFWNRLTTDLGLEARLPPPLFSRNYALVQVAIYDALVASRDRLRVGLSERVVAAGAVAEVLRYLFPSHVDRVDEAAAEQVSLAGDPGQASLGAWNFGRAVGKLVVARGREDGSDAPFTGTMPTGDGVWTGTNPMLPMCGAWRTWILSSGSEIQPEPPYAFASPEDLRDIQEVYDVSLHRTPEQIKIVHKWADLSPPAIWNALLDERIEAGALDLAAAARAHAYLNVAMADAFIACWQCKYTYWIARPFQRIPGLVSVIPTPNFPSYTSGHATISAAAAVVMGEFFPTERAYFATQAEEAAVSRLYAGIHFRHDNDQGLAVGRMIGERAIARMRRGGTAGLIAGR